MRRRSNTITNSKRDGWCILSAARRIHETRCFMHLSERVICGFLMHHAYGDFRDASDKLIPAHETIKTCGKCKGKGWFGRGRKECPECLGEKTITTHHDDRWVKSSRRKDLLRKRIVATADFNFKKAENVDKLLVNAIPSRVYKCLQNEVDVYPQWVDEIRIGDHKEISSNDARDKIREGLSRRKISPTIKGRDDLLTLYVSHGRDQPLIDVPWASQRLARSFGITCPVSGEFIGRDLLPEHEGSAERRYWPDHALPGGIGMPRPDDFCCKHVKFVSSLTGGLAAKIQRAKSKWYRQFESSPPDEWLLAELLGSQIPKLSRQRKAA